MNGSYSPDVRMSLIPEVAVLNVAGILHSEMTIRDGHALWTLTIDGKSRTRKCKIKTIIVEWEDE